MRNFKKVIAMGLAATMIMGSTVTAFADEGSASGSGEYEGYVEETSAFSVVVPTAAAANQFDFFVDPNGLLSTTNYARLTDVTAADFEEGASLFFTRTPVAAAEGVTAVTKYGKDSEAISFTNQSSYAVNVEVSATVAGADGITLSETGTIADTVTAPTIYLALVTPGEGGDTTTAITADGATVTGTIAGEPSNFEVQYKTADGDKPAGYYYVAKTATESNPLAPWKTYSFHLTGACGGEWTADQAEAAPTVSLTWKVTDPNAVPAGPSLSNATANTTDDGVDFNVTFTQGTALTCEFTGLGDGVTLASVTWGTSTAAMTSTTTNVPLSGASFTINANMWGSASSSDVKYIKLTTSDDKVIVVKVTIA